MKMRNHTALRFFCAFLVVSMFLPVPPVHGQSREMIEQFLKSQRAPTPTDTSRSKPQIGQSFRSQVPQESNTNLPASVPSFSLGPTYQVHILGEVNDPGTFRVPASTRLSEAIALAGGIRPYGAERIIELRRKGAKSQQIDLLSFKIQGNLDANPYLLDNDVIYVPLKKAVVQVFGAVKRPNTYELTKKTTLKGLIKLAGGYSPGVAKSEPIKVIRYVDGRKELLDVPIDANDTSHFEVDNADIVVVPHILTKQVKFDYDVPNLPGDTPLFYPSYEDRVFVLGAVERPGPYQYSPYYDVREYLTQAGGLTKMAKNEDKMHIISSQGERRKITDSTVVNPGDTIVIPERYMRPESVVQLVLGITSAALGITTTILAVTR